MQYLLLLIDVILVLMILLVYKDVKKNVGNN